MTEDWMQHLKPSAERHFDYEDDDYKWDRSSSEPNLSDSNPILGRWSKKFIHEYISVDELKFYRRRKPTDFHTRSSICLFNKDEPIVPFASLKTEYRRRFKTPLLFLKPSLLRKHTTLKLEGQMGTETEHKANYLPYPEEEILKCRPSPTKNPEHLKLCGEFEFFPEYRSSFIEHPLTERSIRIPQRGTLNIDDIFNVIPNKSDNRFDKCIKQSTSESMIAKKIDSHKCNLKLEGEMYYVPEYRSKFIEFPIEKSQSIPQLSSIKFHGTFDGIPEYRENYKFYENCYSKSAPIKKNDNINFCDNFVTVPEYKEKYKEPDKTAINRTVSLKSEDNLQTKSEFTKSQPEYYESYKDPQIKEKPERGKCREPYLRLKGKIEFNPEYRSTYLNYPRSRPITTKQSTSSIRLSNTSMTTMKTSSDTTPRRKYKSLTTSPKKCTSDTNQELPFTCQPEYRKAKREYLIKERPITRKITENDGAVKNISKNYNASSSTAAGSDTKSQKLNRARITTKRNSTGDNSKLRDDISPQFRLNVENIEDFEKKFHKPSPKFGRRASVRANHNHHNAVRDKTKVIECNSKYSLSTRNTTKKPPQPPLPPSHRKHNNDDSSFIILDEPCKKNAWMKKSWYEP